MSIPEIISLIEDMRATLIDLRSDLETIEAGSRSSGRWRNARGEDCEADEPGAVWAEFTLAEQAEWNEQVNALANAMIERVALALDGPTLGSDGLQDAFGQDEPSETAAP